MNRDIEGFTVIFLFLLSILCSTQMIACVTDTLKATQLIKDGETIISSGGSFELGFFSPDRNSTRWYVGIWYKKISIRTVVWVANREVPLVNRSGFLEIIKPGILVIRNDRNTIIWSSSISSRSVQNPVAQLLETGNLVVRDANEDLPDTILWQSFDNPTDTSLLGMKIGRNFVTGQHTYLSSWKNYEDPAPGEYSYGYDHSGYPQFFLKRGSDPLYRLGPWNGKGFSGVSSTMRLDPVLTYQIVFNEEELYFGSSMISRFTLSPSGVGYSWTWDDHTKSWEIYLSYPADTCDSYGICGAYGSCNTRNYPVCGCLDKFSPRDPEKWAKGNWSSGCVQNIPLNCQGGDGFMKYSGYKLPDTRISSFNRSLSLEECKMVCLKNCSCTAYSSIEIRGSGCLLWFGNLTDMKVMHDAGQDIYIRMASSESGSSSGYNGKKRKILVISSSLLICSLMVGLLHLWRRTKNHSKLKKRGQIHDNDCTMELIKKDLELHLFNLSTIIKATNHFSNHNKVGEGGFSTVYKGILEEGQEIAVKRLSETSTQGLDGFKNEVICNAKLRHRNLVKLLGCCTEGRQKMLIYEYMPNRSLHSFIFDQTMSKLLDWPKRFHIIQGIARGLLYLHHDSPLRIIHRDLKASNILLDADLNPKISDFGIAKSFRGDEMGANTSRVVGTLGYMSPEYAVHGLFSIKSDVFSLGVVLLEIVSGKRNRGFVHHDHYHNLLGHAWKLYEEGRAVELVDSHLGNSYCLSEVVRTIHVGLLCVQQCPEDRPSMSSVVFMLGNEGLLLPQAKKPGFFLERNVIDVYTPPRTYASSSNDEGTITLLQAR